MPTEEQFDELLRQIAALTERVYKLEQRLGGRPTPAKPFSLIPPSAPPASPLPAVPATPDIESKIGAHWLNRVGIIAVLIGVSYFLKYAFENDWVGPEGRVLIGLVAGVGVVIWSEQVRQSGFTIFSYSLKAIGIGVLYLSLWASSQLYQIVSNPLAFFAMTSVTAATVVLALWQDSELIAGFATLGALITPVLLSSGENNAVSLFTYILVLGVGALLLCHYRPWTRVLILSFVGTFVLYSSWHSQFYTPDQFLLAAVAITAMFFVFVLAPFVNRHASDGRAMALLALANAPIYFFELWELFNHSDESRASAVAAVLLGGVYFVLASLLEDRSPEVISPIHWSIGATLLVIAVPLGFDGKWITVGWVFEGGALAEIGRRTRKEYLKSLGAFTLVLGIWRLAALDDFEVLRLILNERILTFAFTIAILIFVTRNYANARREEDRTVVAVLVVTVNVLALVALNREVHDAFAGIVRNFAYSALWMAYGAGLMFAGFWKKSRFLRWQALILVAITIGKVFIYDTSSLDRGYRILSLIALGIVLLVMSFLYQRNWFKLESRS